MSEKRSIIAALRRVFEQLVSDPSRIAAIGRRAQDRVFERFTWDAKAEQIHEVYRWVLGERKDRPVFDGAQGPTHVVAEVA